MRSMLGLVALVVAASMQAFPGQPRARVTIGVAGRANEYVSAASHGSWVALAWSASSDATGTDVFAAISRDSGASFGAPVRVNVAEGQASINGEQPPRVAFGTQPDGRRQIVVIWTARGETGTLLLSARSVDDGRTFKRSRSVPGTDAPGNRGWQSMMADAGGRLYALWLDHRDTTVQTTAGHAVHPHGESARPATTDGAAKAQLSQLFVAALDGSIAPRGIARGVCYCCKTAVATGRDDAVYAAWRHVYAGNTRDIAFTVSQDGGRSFADPVRVSEDNWQLDGCPENGPALAIDAAQRVHVVWPTLVREGERETLKLFLASTADGRTFTPRAALPTIGAAYHPQLGVAPDGTLIVAWDEVASEGRRVRLARGRPDAGGTMRFAASTLSDGASAVHPALAMTPSRLVVAWTARTGSQSRIVVSSVPY